MSSLKSVKSVWFVWFLVLGQQTFAENCDPSFRASSLSLPNQGAGLEGQSAIVARLKHMAILECFQRRLGPDFSKFEAQLTPQVTEPMVIEYGIRKTGPGGKGPLEVFGTRDVTAIDAWLRTHDTKATSGSSLRPVFLISSDVPNWGLSPKETASRVRGTHFSQTVFSMVNGVLLRFNLKAGLAEEQGLGMIEPPRRESELRTLRDYAQLAGYNAAIWVHFTPCPGCGIKADIFLYNLVQPRLVLARTDEIRIDPAFFGQPEKLRNALKEPFKEWAVSVEEAIGSGALFGSSYRLIVQGVDSYQAFNQIERGLSSQRRILKLTLKRSERGIAEFNVLTLATGDELADLLRSGSFNGFTLQPVQVDPPTLVVRYSKS